MFSCSLIDLCSGGKGRGVAASVFRQVYLIQTTPAQLRHHFSFRMEVKVALIINTKHKKTENRNRNRNQNRNRKRHNNNKNNRSKGRLLGSDAPPVLKLEKEIMNINIVRFSYRMLLCSLTSIKNEQKK